jgi:hypothetical protein
MASIAAQMTAVYVFVDDYLKAHPALSQWRSSNNGAPAFTDAEVLTVALLQGCLGVATLKQTYAAHAGCGPARQGPSGVLERATAGGISASQSANSHVRALVAREFIRQAHAPQIPIRVSTPSNATSTRSSPQR